MILLQEKTEARDSLRNQLRDAEDNNAQMASGGGPLVERAHALKKKEAADEKALKEVVVSSAFLRALSSSFRSDASLFVRFQEQLADFLLSSPLFHLLQDKIVQSAQTVLNIENSSKHYEGKLVELEQQIAQAEADRDVIVQEVNQWTIDVVSPLPFPFFAWI